VLHLLSLNDINKVTNNANILKMKTFRFFAVGLAFMATSAMAQAPQNIGVAFKNKYPNASVKKFKFRHDNYVASFVDGGKKCKAFFDEKGNWVQT